MKYVPPTPIQLMAEGSPNHVYCHMEGTKGEEVIMETLCSAVKCSQFLLVLAQHNYSWFRVPPAQLILVSGPAGTHDQIFVRSQTIHIFENGGSL
jgi:hypothetical protein